MTELRIPRFQECIYIVDLGPQRCSLYSPTLWRMDMISGNILKTVAEALPSGPRLLGRRRRPFLHSGPEADPGSG